MDAYQTTSKSSGASKKQYSAKMKNMKYEIANEFNLPSTNGSIDWANLTSRQCGSVGGEMVRRMVREYQATH